ncbi:MAG TPA: tetratricopeptide repeat protein, partial [Candidatus Methanoperedens sp.]|nr:tetratricopeptide repeat protein [Candidatus Methanoperedens sp.]
MNADAAGFLAIDRGDYQEAVNIFLRSLQKGKDPSGYYGFGLAHFLLEDYATARRAFHKTLELDPGNPEAIRRLSMMEKPEFDAGKTALPPPHHERRFRAEKSYLEVHRGGWKKLFIKGINLGIGLPGSFPGEYAVKKGTYRKWFGQISAIGINALRIYTLHPPSFYEALDEWNRSGKTL